VMIEFIFRCQVRGYHSTHSHFRSYNFITRVIPLEMSWFSWGKKEDKKDPAQASPPSGLRQAPAATRVVPHPPPPPPQSAPTSASAIAMESGMGGVDDMFSGMDLMTTTIPQPQVQQPAHQQYQQPSGGSAPGPSAPTEPESPEMEGSAFGFLDDDEEEGTSPAQDNETPQVDNSAAGLSAHPSLDLSAVLNSSTVDPSPISEPEASLFAEMEVVQPAVSKVPSVEVISKAPVDQSLFNGMTSVDTTSQIPQTQSKSEADEDALSPTSDSEHDVADKNIKKMTRSVSTALEAIFAAAQAAFADREKLAALHASLEDAEKAVRQAQEEQEQAVELEDFEKADALNAVIAHRKATAESLRNEVSTLEAHMQAEAERVRRSRESLAPEEFEALISDVSLEQFEKAFTLATTVRDRVSDVLRHERKMQQEDIEDERRTLETTLKKEVDSVKIDHAHTISTMKHLDEDLANIEAEIAKIKRDESAETAEEEARQSKLAVEQLALEAEVQALERQLAEKQRELRAKLDELEHCEQRIAVIRGGFERRVRKALERKDKVQTELSEAQNALEQLRVRAEKCLEKQIRIALKDLSIELDVRRMDRAEDATRRQLLRLHASANLLRQAGAQYRSLASQQIDSGTELKSLDEQLRKLEDAREALQAQEAEHEALIANANLRIPVLNAEKKSAAAAKNFKVAAALNKDIAALNDSKAASEAELERIKAERDSLLAERAQVQSQLDEASAALKKQEASRDLGIATHYIKTAKELYALKLETDKSICEFRYLAMKDAEKIAKCKRGETLPTLGLPLLSADGETPAHRSLDLAAEPTLFQSDQAVLDALQAESERLALLARTHVEEACKLKQRYGNVWDLDTSVTEGVLDVPVIEAEVEARDQEIQSQGTTSVVQPDAPSPTSCAASTQVDDETKESAEIPQADDSAPSSLTIESSPTKPEPVDADADPEQAEVIPSEPVPAQAEPEAEQELAAVLESKEGQESQPEAQLQLQEEEKEATEDDVLAAFLQDDGEEPQDNSSASQESLTEDGVNAKRAEVTSIVEQIEAINADVAKFEAMVEEASAAEDFEQADLLQTRVNDLVTKKSVLTERLEALQQELAGTP